MTEALVPYTTRTLDDTMTLGKVLAQSGYFADSREAAQAVVKILAGQELGFGPIASMTGVNIIKGKVTLSANLIASAIKRSGRYNYRVVTLTDDACRIDFYEAGERIGTSEFSTADAKAAGLAGDNWRKFPRNMLFARAISNGAKWYCPDLSGGPLYTPDELGAQVDGETGEVIDAPAPRIVVERQPEPQNGAQQASTQQAQDPPGFSHGFGVWAVWTKPEHAIAWGLSQGVFDHQKHAENAYAKVKSECQPKKASDMWQCWYQDVQRRLDAKALANMAANDGLDDEPTDPVTAGDWLDG